MYLTIDIGGTNVRARIWTTSSHQEEICILRKQFVSSSQTLSEIQDFIREHQDKIQTACIAVAGPVQNGRVQLTNVDISLDERDFSIPVRIINDMEAAGYGISELSSHSIHSIFDGNVDVVGVATVVGLGTGVGQTIVVPSNPLPYVLPSEGGHIEYAPRNQEELDFCSFLQSEKKILRPRVEDILSGDGITHIWDFYALKHAFHQKIEGHVGQYISKNPEHEMAKQVMHLYSGMLGSYLGNLSLQTLPSGGIWICGGVAQKMYKNWDTQYFRTQFVNKAPMEHILQDISIRVVLDDDIGVLGALRVAKTLSLH